MSNKVNNVPQHKTIPATPTTPDTGFGKIYIKTDRLWYGLDDLGVETPLSGGGGGGGISLTDLSAVSPLTYNNSTGSFSINQSSGLADGYLSSTDWTTFNNKVSQISGTQNFVAKFTPSSSVITVSQIYDNGTCLAIGYGPTVVTSHKFSVNGQGSNASNGGYFINDNVLADSTGYGLVGASIKTTGTNIGVSGRAITGNTGTNIGIIGTASGGASNYAIQLEDGTQAIAGRFLKNIVDGKANWANITAADVSGVQGSLTLTTTGNSGAATLIGNTLNIPQYSGGGGGGVSGSGTLNKLTKWTPNGTTIGDSAIIENSSGEIGIGINPISWSKMYISTSTNEHGIMVRTSNGVDGSTGILSEAFKQGAPFNNQGVEGNALGSTTENIGIVGNASAQNSLYPSKQMGGKFFAQNGIAFPLTTSDPGAIAIGIVASASSEYGGSAYFAQFNKYGVTPLNKVVLSDNLNGYADWGKVTSAYTTGASGTFTSADGKTITVTNGLITSIV